MKWHFEYNHVENAFRDRGKCVPSVRKRPCSRSMPRLMLRFVGTVLVNTDLSRRRQRVPKVAFPSGEGGFPRKRLRCSGKDGRGPRRWDNVYRNKGAGRNVRGPLPTRYAGHLPQRGRLLGTASARQICICLRKYRTIRRHIWRCLFRHLLLADFSIYRQ